MSLYYQNAQRKSGKCLHRHKTIEETAQCRKALGSAEPIITAAYVNDRIRPLNDDERAALKEALR